jgi:FMN phosphatase YigB (HAD superfamily)
MHIESKEKTRLQKALFVDFNGVISYEPFWASMKNPAHPLHSYYEKIENLLFRGENKIEGLLDDWMLGKYTSEQIHQIISDKTGAPYQTVLDVFCTDCKQLDISQPILQGIQALRKDWYCVLRTDNMDTFHRFTLPANPHLAEAFDEVHCSYTLGQLKKTDGGKYFTTTVSALGIGIGNCALIDDSNSNCKIFETLGGKAYRTQTETEVTTLLKNLLAK